MRLSQDIEEYDVKSLSAIGAIVESILKKCKMLDDIALMMDKNIERAQSDFTSENMERAKVIIRKYNERLSNAQEELIELLKSVDEFTEKLHHAWREW